MAAGAGIFESARSRPMRTIASRCVRMDIVSDSKEFARASCASNLLSWSPIDWASPESSTSVRDVPTRYNPNLSEEEPLFRASTFAPGSASIMRVSDASRGRVPAPVADLRHVVAMLADIKLVTLHGGPVTRRRHLHLTAEARNAPNGIERELIAIEIIQHHHV